MKKILLPLLFVLAACAGDVTEAESTISLGNPDLMAQACNSGYARIAPRYCGVVGTAVNSALTVDNTCQNFSAPSGALRVELVVTPTIKSANAIALRTLQVQWFADTSCSVSLNYTILWQGREWAAVVAGTTIYNFHIQLIVPVTNGNVYYIATNTSGGTGTGINQTTTGYYD